MERPHLMFKQSGVLGCYTFFFLQDCLQRHNSKKNKKEFPVNRGFLSKASLSYTPCGKGIPQKLHKTSMDCFPSNLYFWSEWWGYNFQLLPLLPAWGVLSHPPPVMPGLMCPRPFCVCWHRAMLLCGLGMCNRLHWIGGIKKQGSLSHIVPVSQGDYLGDQRA